MYWTKHRESAVDVVIAVHRRHITIDLSFSLSICCCKKIHALSSQFIFKANFQRGYDPNEYLNLCWCSADSSTNTVAILAQGTSWAVAVTQAFCCMVQIHSGLLYVVPTSNVFLAASLLQLVPPMFCVWHKR